MRRDAGIRALADLAGKTLAVGSRDSTQARILPLALPAAGGGRPRRVTLLPFDTDLGKHGDTGTSELDVLRALHDGRAEAGAVGDLVWVDEQAAGRVDPSAVEVLWTTPAFDHCMFDALPDARARQARAFQRALFAMQWDNPAHRRLLELEGLRQWMPPREEGYASLRDGARRERPAGERGPPRPGRRRRRPARSAAGCSRCVRPALDSLEPGGVLALLSSSPRRARGPARRGAASSATSTSAASADARRPRPAPRRGRRGRAARCRALAARDGRLAPRPAAASRCPSAPTRDRLRAARRARRARRPAYPFTLLERDRVAPPEVAQLYDQAVAAQWDATRDIPWDTVRPLPAGARARGRPGDDVPRRERALGALRAGAVPARASTRPTPRWRMFLATQLADEARHIDVFLKRARAGGGGAGVSCVTTARSLLSLLELEDFTEAAFLLSVLGEGTFLDLLRFVEEHAPDEATAELARRARARRGPPRPLRPRARPPRAVAHDPTRYARLEAAVRRRAAALHGASGVPAPVQDALTVLAAGGDEPARDRAAATRRSASCSRRCTRAASKRLRARRLHARRRPQALSDLHTPNFM